MMKNCCPSFEELEKLANGELTAARASELKSHIASCSDCRDFYDGIKELGTDFIDSAAADINERIDLRVEQLSRPKKSIVLKFTKYAAAAAIAGLAVFATYKLADNKPAESAGEVAIVDSVADEPKQESKEAVTLPAEEIAVQPEVKKEEKAAMHSEAVAGKESTSSEGYVADSEIILRGRADQDVSGQLQNTRGWSKPVDASKFVEKIKSADSFILSGDYFEAKDALEDVLNEDPNNYEAYKKLGICNMKLGYYSQALDNFNHLMPQTQAEKDEINGYIKVCKQNIK